MASTYSTNLGFELITTGEQAGTWGTTTNTNLGTLVEQAISGYVVVSFAAGDVTLTMTNGVSATPRNIYLECQGATADRTLTVPLNRKLYFVYNNTSYNITVKTAATAGVTIPAGARYSLVCDGSAISLAITALNGLGTSNYLVKYTGASTTGNSVVYDDGAGNIGIGTTTPSSKLHVYGTSPAITSEASTASNGHYISKNTSRSYAFGTYGAGGAYIIYDLTGAQVAYKYAPSATGYHAFSINNSEKLRLSQDGYLGVNTSTPTQALQVSGGVGYNAPVTFATVSYTVGITDNWIIANYSTGQSTITLPAAASFTGRILHVKTIQAQAVVSASNNVKPIDSNTAGNAIVTATAGKWATLVSDGTNWVIMQAG